MSFQFSLVGPQIKYFKTVLLSLSKTEASELLFEAFPDKLILRSINSSRSAYLAVTLGSAFFDEYQLHGSVVQAAVLLKHALAVFASARVVRVSFQMAGVEVQLTARLFCENGLRKVYGICCLDTDVVNAAVDESQYPVTMVALAGDLQGLLASFQSDHDELTIIARPAGSTPGCHCELRTFHDPSVRWVASTLRTEVSFDAQNLFSEYEHTSQHAIDATFNVHDLKAIVFLLSQVGADVCLKMDSAGTPLVVQPRWPPNRSRRDMVLDMDLDAKMVLATLGRSQVGVGSTASRATADPDHRARSVLPGSSVPSARTFAGTTQDTVAPQPGAPNAGCHANPSRRVWASPNPEQCRADAQGSTGLGSGSLVNSGRSNRGIVHAPRAVERSDHEGRNPQTHGPAAGSRRNSQEL